MVQYGYSEIPSKYIKRRWTKEARISIPEYLKDYVRDTEASASRTYRHSSLHTTALEMLKLADTNTETYRKTMEVMIRHTEDLKTMVGTSHTTTQETRRSERAAGKKRVVVDIYVGGESNSGSEKNDLSEEDNENCSVESEDIEDADVTENIEVNEDSVNTNLLQILPPEVRRGRGRPRLKRFKSKGELASQKVQKTRGAASQTINNKDGAGSTSGTARPMQIRYCKKCGAHGHNSRTCGGDSTYTRK